MTQTVRQIAPVGSPSIGGQQQTGALVVAPQNFSEVMQFADRMAESRFVPAHLRNRPADCLAVCMQALRWEADPYMVAQKTYFTKEGAPPGYEAQLINAIVYARAPLDGRLDIRWDGKWPNRVCTVTGRIRRDPNPKIRSINAANIRTRNSPLWKDDPDQQLAYYATRAWARLYCPDVIMGIYTPDEVRGGYAASDVAMDITPPTRLDALEQVLDTDAVADEPHDAETGEIIEPGADEPARDEFGLPPVEEDRSASMAMIALASRLETDMQGPQTKAELVAWWKAQDTADMREVAPDLFNDLLAKVKARDKLLKK